MASMEGGTLFDYLLEKKYLTEKEARGAMHHICTAVKFLHDNNCTHRDIKCENVIFTKHQKMLKLTDFGISKEVLRQPTLREAYGTITYAAPEIFENTIYDRKCDVWSLGVLLYLVLYGRYPYHPQISHRDQLLDLQCRPISEEAKDLIRNMLVIKPQNRFTIDDVINHHWMLLEVSDESSTTSEEPSDKKIQTYLSIKPSSDFSNIYKVDNNVLLCNIPEDSYLFRKIKDKSLKKQFLFTKIYGPNVGQTELFNDCVKRNILNFINGQNSTLFSYGASGSGKTYTILGTTENPGVIPRSLEYVFRTISTVNKIPSTKPQTTSSLIYLDRASAKLELKKKEFLA